MSTATRPSSATSAVDPAVWRIAYTVIVGALAVVFDTTIVSVRAQRSGQGSARTDQHHPVGEHRISAGGVYHDPDHRLGAVRRRRKATLDRQPRRVPARLGCSAHAPGTPTASSPSGWSRRRRRHHDAAHDDLDHAGGDGRNVAPLCPVVTLPASLGRSWGRSSVASCLSFGDWRWLFLINVPFLRGRRLPGRAPTCPDDRPPPPDQAGLGRPVAALARRRRRHLRTQQGRRQRRLPEHRCPRPAGRWAAARRRLRVLALPREAEALVNVRLFRYRPMASSSILRFLAGAALYGALFLLPLVLGSRPAGPARSMPVCCSSRWASVAMVSRRLADSSPINTVPEWLRSSVLRS